MLCAAEGGLKGAHAEEWVSLGALRAISMALEVWYSTCLCKVQHALFGECYAGRCSFLMSAGVHDSRRPNVFKSESGKKAGKICSKAIPI